MLRGLVSVLLVACVVWLIVKATIYGGVLTVLLVLVLVALLV